MSPKLPVVVLGATGMVGQRAVAALQDHPWLYLAGLAASPRSVGKPYADACRWRLPGEAYAGQAAETVLPCDPGAVMEKVGRPGFALSALDRDIAREVEPAFARAGWLVVSNASAFRMDAHTPLVIPEINPNHLALLDRQPTPGKIIANPNCVAIPLALSLAPLHQALGVEQVVAASYQAVSGAGYPGESAWDMIGNVHPHPGDEEEKVESETQKILGAVADGAAAPAPFGVSARCVRVPVLDGHLIAVSVKTTDPVTPDQAARLFRDWRPDCGDLPSSPDPVLRLTDGRDRPSPHRDVDAGGGMAVAIGRIEACPVMGLKYFALTHNVVRGAAGAALLNAELLAANGWAEKVLG